MKDAAVACQIPAFRAYMPPATAAKILEQDEEMQAIRQSLDDLFAQAQRRFGAKVHRESHGLKFNIDATDPRWPAVFGPQWESIRSAPGPKFFFVNADLFWKEECDVLRVFAACLEDETSCSRPDVPGSVLQIRKEDGQWRLRAERSPAQERGFARVVAFLRSSIAACSDDLARAPSTSSDEDVLLTLASRYMTATKAFAASE